MIANLHTDRGIILWRQVENSRNIKMGTTLKQDEIRHVFK